MQNNIRCCKLHCVLACFMCGLRAEVEIVDEYEPLEEGLDKALRLSFEGFILGQD